MKKKLSLSVVLALLMMGASARETVVWKGNKSFASWSDVLNIEGSVFNQTRADDVLLLSGATRGETCIVKQYIAGGRAVVRKERK